MTTDEMMAEVRKAHPRSIDGQDEGGWFVYADRGAVGWDGQPTMELVGMGGTRREAVEKAYRAVRKAGPKPMTVAEAKAIVLGLHPEASDGVHGTHEGYAYHIYDGASPILPHPKLGIGKTEGQAWKAAAKAIREREVAG